MIVTSERIKSDSRIMSKRSARNWPRLLLLTLSAYIFNVTPVLFEVGTTLVSGFDLGCGMLVLTIMAPISLPVLLATIVIWFRRRRFRDDHWWFATVILGLFFSYSALAVFLRVAGVVGH